jgi:hypothetical protein
MQMYLTELSDFNPYRESHKNHGIIPYIEHINNTGSYLYNTRSSDEMVANLSPLSCPCPPSLQLREATEAYLSECDTRCEWKQTIYMHIALAFAIHVNANIDAKLRGRIWTVFIHLLATADSLVVG